MKQQNIKNTQPVSNYHKKGLSLRRSATPIRAYLEFEIVSKTLSLIKSVAPMSRERCGDFGNTG